MNISGLRTKLHLISLTLPMNRGIPNSWMICLFQPGIRNLLFEDSPSRAFFASPIHLIRNFV